MKQVIRLRGISREIRGEVWESDAAMCVGKQPWFQIVLDDSSVSREHAELKAVSEGWTIRDLASTNGTFVNGIRLGTDDRPLQSRDIVQFGMVAMIAEFGEDKCALPEQEQTKIRDTDPGRGITPMGPAPSYINSLRVLCYSPIDARHQFTGNNTRRYVRNFWEDEILFGRMAGLAICQGPDIEVVLLVGCDQDWRPQWTTACVDVKAAREQAEFEYKGVDRTWERIG